jgi:hypothetical protein
MSGPTVVGRAIERALQSYDAQPSLVQVVTGIVLGLAVTAASLVVFRITLQILVDYFR